MTGPKNMALDPRWSYNTDKVKVLYYDRKHLVHVDIQWLW